MPDSVCPRGRALLTCAALGMCLALSGCGSNGPPRYATIADLTQAALARLAVDRSGYSHAETSITVDGTEMFATAAETRFALGPAGPRQYERDHYRQNGGSVDTTSSPMRPMSCSSPRSGPRTAALTCGWIRMRRTSSR